MDELNYVADIAKNLKKKFSKLSEFEALNIATSIRKTEALQNMGNNIFQIKGGLEDIGKTVGGNTDTIPQALTSIASSISDLDFNN